MRKLINYKLIFLSSFFLAACSNEDNIPSILPSNQPDAVELGITGGDAYEKRGDSEYRPYGRDRRICGNSN